MTVLLAVTVVGLGSLAFRLVPLLMAGRIPQRWILPAECASLAVLVTVVARMVLNHQDPSVPAAPLVAGLALAVGLLVAARWGSVLLSVVAGAATYVVVGAVLTAMTG